MSDWTGKDRRKPPPVDPAERLIIEVPLETNLDRVLRLLVEALAGGGVGIPDIGFIRAELELIRGLLENEHGPIANLNRKVDIMSSNLERIEKEAADAAENVGLVRTAIEGLKTIQEEMKTEIAALKDQVAKGQLDQARLDAAAAVFEKADEDLDAVILPPAPDEGGEPDTGGGETPASR